MRRLSSKMAADKVKWQKREAYYSLVWLCALWGPLWLQAVTPDDWRSAPGGSGVEYRWSHGFEGACHLEFRDPTITGTSLSTEITGVINYDRTSLDGVERNALQPFHVRITAGFGNSNGPDVYCQQINDLVIQELRRFK